MSGMKRAFGVPRCSCRWIRTGGRAPAAPGSGCATKRSAREAAPGQGAAGDRRRTRRSRELRALRSVELPPTVAKFVDRLAASLQSSKPLSLQIEVSAAPDTNINRATSSDTLGTVIGDFDLSDEAKAKSGIGFGFRGMARARTSLSSAMTIEARSGLEANIYRHKEFNDISLDVSVGPRLRVGSSSFGLEVGAVQQW